MEKRAGLGPRKIAWIAVGFAGLPGAVFGALAVVIGGFFAIVFLGSVVLARFPALDHAISALLAVYLPVQLAYQADGIGALLALSIFCTALAMAKLGRIAGSWAWGLLWVRN